MQHFITGRFAWGRTGTGKHLTAQGEGIYAAGEGASRMLRDVNRNPRRWVDESGRVLVIEGWHPSVPSEVGFNVKVDGDWLGTFASLEAAARAAGVPSGAEDRKVVLRPDPSGPGSTVETTLRLVRPISNDSP